MLGKGREGKAGKRANQVGPTITSRQQFNERKDGDEVLHQGLILVENIRKGMEDFNVYVSSPVSWDEGNKGVLHQYRPSRGEKK